MFGAIAGGIASALAGGAMSKLFGGGQKAASGGIQGDVLATDNNTVGMGDAGIKSAIQGSNVPNPDEAVPSFVSGAMAKAGKGLLEGTLQAGTSAVSDKLLDLVGLGGKSAADKGKDTRDYLAAAFPELNAWERAGADASSAGMVDAGFENQKELTKMQLDNQKEIAEMQNETQKEIAGIQSATSRQNTKDQVYAQNEMLAYQQKESTARVASIMENTNLSKQQQVSEIMRQMLTQAQTAGQYFTNDQIKEMTRKVSAEVDLVHQQTQNQRYGSSHIGATAQDLSNVVTDAASRAVDICPGIAQAVADTGHDFSVGKYYHLRGRFRDHLLALGGHELRDAVETAGESNTGRRFPAEGGGKPVVAASRSERILRSSRAGGIELEHGARVVVEAPNKVWVQVIFDAGRIKQLSHCLPRRGAGLAEMVGDSRRIRLEGLALGHLAVKEPEWIHLDPVLALAVEPRFEGPVVGAQEIQIRRPADGVPDGVQLQGQLFQPNFEEPCTRDLDHLCVESGAGTTDGLDVELEELAVAAFLGSVVAEHRAHQVQTRRLRSLVQAALEVRAHDAGGGLRAQRELAAAAVLEAIQLLGGGVAVLADSTLDQLPALDDRCLDLSISEA